jgi:hypothetical protein
VVTDQVGGLFGSALMVKLGNEHPSIGDFDAQILTQESKFMLLFPV